MIHIQQKKLIWEAIKNRHTFATSGATTRLHFGINGYHMGSNVSLIGVELPDLNIFATGADEPIVKMEIIKNGDGANPVHTVYFNHQDAIRILMDD